MFESVKDCVLALAGLLVLSAVFWGLTVMALVIIGVL